MGPQHLIGVVMVLAFLGGVAVMSRRMRAGWGPRQNQRMQRRVFYAFLLLFLIAGGAQLMGGRVQWGFLAFWAVFICVQGYAAFRIPTPDEHLLDFAQDPRHCGQCAYDLTGNTSGVCPECGWTVPPVPQDVESPTWFHWWSGWEIAYLKNWRRTLWGVLAGAGAFLGLTIVFSLWIPSPLIALPVLMTLHFALNAVRIVAYGRRHSGSHTGSASV